MQVAGINPHLQSKRLGSRSGPSTVNLRSHLQVYAHAGLNGRSLPPLSLLKVPQLWSDAQPIKLTPLVGDPEPNSYNLQLHPLGVSQFAHNGLFPSLWCLHISTFNCGMASDVIAMLLLLPAFGMPLHVCYAPVDT